MPDTFIGQEIDGYRVLEELGRGGMGVVYKAEDVALARTVALKMIAREFAGDASFARRFRSEARALARIDSPHITRIYALRRTEAGLFIVMEYIGGGALSDRIDRGVVAWPEARQLVLDMVAALEHAHGVGVIHRDVKPGNILLSEAGRVKITDFGLAKLRTPDGTATLTQGVAGTLYYMSPEQVRGEQSLDNRSDLYALGVTVYELLSGQLPFARGGTEFATMRAIVEDEYPPLVELVPAVPPPVSAAVMKALAKAPDDRYANAAAMRAAFESIGPDGRPAHTLRREVPTVVDHAVDAPEAEPAPASLPARLRWAAGGLVLLVFALLVFALLVLFWPSAGEPRLGVVTDPPGATVYWNGERLGETPVGETEVSEGEGRLRVERLGYAPVDTALALGAGQAVALRLALVPLAEGHAVPRLLEVASTPAGAAVFVNGERAGETPLTYRDTTASPVALRLERAGYEPWEEAGLRLHPDVATRRAVALQPVQTRLPADPPPADPPPDRPLSDRPPSGTLVLSPASGGRASVAGQDGGGPFSLAPGQYTVRCAHPNYAPFERTARVRAGRTTSAACHFETRVNVQANPVWGYIWIDGADSGETTPESFMLGPGTYRIEVRREGYEPAGPAQEITLAPGLEPQTEPLVFELRRP